MSDPARPDTTAPAADPADRFARDVDELTHAFGDPTRRDIWLHVRAASAPVTATEIAEAFGIHANVARHHLEKLLEAGFVVVAPVDAGGARAARGSAGAARGAGRPSKRYVASGKQVAVSMPLRDDRLLSDLLLHTLTALEPEQAETLAEAAGRRFGTELAAARARGEHLSRADALAAVAAELRQKGFAADARPDDGELVTSSCPFGELAEQYPHVVCALDRGMVEGMLEALSGEGAEAHLRASRPQGDDECVTSL